MRFPYVRFLLLLFSFMSASLSANDHPQIDNMPSSLQEEKAVSLPSLQEGLSWNWDTPDDSPKKPPHAGYDDTVYELSEETTIVLWTLGLMIVLPSSYF